MKNYIKGLFVIICIVGSLFMNSGCTGSDFLSEDNDYKSDESLITRAYNGTTLDELKSTPAFDFKIYNNTAYDLGGIYINLAGNIGGSYTTLFSSDPGMVSAGETMEGFPTILGYPLSAPPGTPVTNLNLDFYAYNYLSQIVEVRVRIDDGPHVYGFVTFGSSGNTVRISLPNSTVPSASRRTVTVEIYRPR